jgi:adenylate kinase family enzyme
MKIMVIGAKSAGKSTFSNKLSKKLNIPVSHIDEIVNNVGRDNNKVAEDLIKSKADELDWILDGNSFTRDRSYRLMKADYIILFKINPFKSFFSHMWRWYEEKKNQDKERFGRSKGLHLGFAFNFAFRRWPKREKEIIADIKNLKKDFIVIKNFKEADNFVESAKISSSGTKDILSYNI